MHLLPQEIEVWYIIPAFRRELARCLITDFHFSYGRVGIALGISKAAVSQYMKHKRASKVKLSSALASEVMRSCKRIAVQHINASCEILRLLELMRKKQLKCEVCEHDEKGVLGNCKEILYSDPCSQEHAPVQRKHRMLILHTR